jgi:hypothetical protein
VCIGASIDHFGKKLEFIRHPIKYETLLNNIKKINEYAGTRNSVSIYVSLTLSIFNVFDIDEIFKTYESLGLHVNINLLTEPKCLSIKYLPDAEKEKLLFKFEQLGNPKFLPIVAALTCSDPMDLSQSEVTKLRVRRIKEIESTKHLVFSNIFNDTAYEWLRNELNSGEQ